MSEPAPEVPVATEQSQELTIDELGRSTGTTVRNIRAYQSRGLLPPPAIRGRTGYYGRDHVARLELIQTLQAEGFRLDAIQRLMSRPGGAPEQILSFGRALLSSFGESIPEFATTSELEQRFGGPLDPKLTRKAVKLGLIRALGEDRWEVRNPTLLAAGEQLVAMGIPLSHGLAVADAVEQHTRAIAKSYARLFLADVVGGESISERSPEDWERLRESFDRLRPLAMEAIRASFEQAMGELVEHHLKRLIDR